MGHDQLKSHLEESQLAHSLMFMQASQKTSNKNQHRIEELATQVDVMKKSLSTAETQIAGHEWALRNLYQVVMNIAEDRGWITRMDTPL